MIEITMGRISGSPELSARSVSKGLWKRHIGKLSSRVASSNMPLPPLQLTTVTDGHEYLVDTRPSLNRQTTVPMGCHMKPLHGSQFRISLGLLQNYVILLSFSLAA